MGTKTDTASETGIDAEAIGEELPLLEGIRTARAIRRLKPDPVPRALIRKVCEAGTFAPSGGNRQPWVFVALEDADRRRWVAATCASPRRWHDSFAVALRLRRALLSVPTATSGRSAGRGVGENGCRGLVPNIRAVERFISRTAIA